MKKLILFISIFCVSAVLFAASYTNNTYQKLADEYTKKAKIAFDYGNYSDAVDYSQKAAENAELSRQYIDMMLVRSNVETQLQLAEERLDWARNIGADKTYPEEYASANQAYSDAQNALAQENFDLVMDYAKKVLLYLENVSEIAAFPEYYIVGPWVETKDCYWNISELPCVYNNPFMWKKLYQENKSDMPNPNNANLIKPGMKIKIPSINGEHREGVYDGSKNYGTFGK